MTVITTSLSFVHFGAEAKSWCKQKKKLILRDEFFQKKEIYTAAASTEL